MRRIPPHNQMTDGSRQIQAASDHFITHALCCPGWILSGGSEADMEAEWTRGRLDGQKHMREEGGEEEEEIENREEMERGASSGLQNAPSELYRGLYSHNDLS